MDVFPSGHDQGRSIITVTGDLDLATADHLRLRLVALIGSARRDIGLDLSGVTFIDCQGLRTLTAVHAHIGANGAGLRLTRLSPVVVRFLELVNATGGTAPPAAALALVASRPAHAGSCRTGTPDPTAAPRFAAAAA